MNRLALAACATSFLGPADALRELRQGGLEALGAKCALRPVEELRDSDASSEALASMGYEALFYGEAGYPEGLADLRRPPAVLFVAGNTSLLNKPGVGLCGSRNASDAGLLAAYACGDAVSRSDLVVISGNARGVDTAAHTSALEAGGDTILVLAEGPLRYRPRRVLREHSSIDHVLVISQFAPRSAWNVGNAMTRNGLIAALGQALVVIEAGAEGGTLDAGLQGLAIGRPVIALEFETGPTPAGNKILHSKGALPVGTPGALRDLLRSLRGSWQGRPQLALPLGAEH